MIEQRYLKSVKYAKNAAADAERQKFRRWSNCSRSTGAVQLRLPADGRAGISGVDAGPDVKSPVGAIGVMQVMPPTGKELKVGDIAEIEPNIHAGVKYMRFMMDHYFKDEPMTI